MAITLPRVWLDTLTRLLARDERQQRLALAQRLASRVLAELNRTFARERRYGRVRRRQRIAFEYPLLLTPDELWCPVDTSSLPAGVFTARLADEEVVRGLCDHTHHEVRVDYLANRKMCYVVRLASHRFPATYSINSVEIPPDAAPLTVPLGVNGEGEQVLADLAELKHLLIAGATGGGKTTLAHAIICTLIGRNDSDNLELWLVDLKRTEFSLYRPLLRSGVVRRIAVEPEEALELLDQAYREIVRRNTLMESAGVNNHRDLARAHGIRLPYIVLIVDEFAILTTDKSKFGRQTVGGAATLLMARIAALGRSAGVHIIISTQMVNAEILSSTIRANFENRICFSTADWRQSQLVIETSEADGLPAGRAILRRDGRTMEVQTCLITARQIKLEVDRIAEFGPDGTGDEIEMQRFVRDARLLIDTACQRYGGVMSRTKMLQTDGIRGVITAARFDEVVQRLERDGVVTPGRARHGRTVMRAFHNNSRLLEVMYLRKSQSESHIDSSTASSQCDAGTIGAPHRIAEYATDTHDAN